jgi:hypothetical protein
MNMPFQAAIAAASACIIVSCSSQGLQVPSPNTASVDRVAPLADALPARPAALPARGTLYVAEGLIASGSSTAGRVVAYAPGTSNVVETITAGAGDPSALAFDTTGRLFVANSSGNSVAAYEPGKTTPSFSFSKGLLGPVALGIHRRLYVANSANGQKSSVTAYSTSTGTLQATIGKGVTYPSALSFDRTGNLYVANERTITVYAPGKTRPSRAISVAVAASAQAIALDTQGYLYVAATTGSAAGVVDEYAPGSSKLVRSLNVAQVGSSGSGPVVTAVALDGSNNLYVATWTCAPYSNSSSGCVFFKGAILVYAPQASTPSRVINGVFQPSLLAIDRRGGFYVADISSSNSSSASAVIRFYPPNAATPRFTIDLSSPPTALALQP